MFDRLYREYRVILVDECCLVSLILQLRDTFKAQARQ